MILLPAGLAIPFKPVFAPSGWRYYYLEITDITASSGAIDEWHLYVGGSPYPAADMTNNTTPAPYIANATTLATNAYKVFDNIPTNTWTFFKSSLPQRIFIDMGSSINPDSFTVGIYSPSYTGPSAINVGAANLADYSDSIVLKSLSGLTWSAYETKSFSIP